MSNHKKTLELLRKLGELRSEQYEINWDEWEGKHDVEMLEEAIQVGIDDFEERFLKIADEMDDYYNTELDEEKAMLLEEIIDTLVQGYVMQSMFRKKKAIEEFISSI